MLVKLSDLLSIHDRIAADLGPCRLVCSHCGVIQPANVADGLRNGWPKHCGTTMTLERTSPRGDTGQGSLSERKV